ncbi:atypical chemokine receptor 2-like [Latimeria chalumnae]|uniref:atypical chemokine receptor 2-like n=1 Tax=Latimeria chalumnae TaxID=7897 RepID=UPI00313B8A24
MGKNPLLPSISPLLFEDFNTSDDNYSSYYDYYAYSQFEACRKDGVKAFSQIFLPIFYMLICCLGLIGNILLVVILIRYAKIKTMTEVYLLNLAVSDLLFVFTLPFWTVYAATEWKFGNAFCKIVSTVYTTNIYSGVFFIICLSLDRYLEIVHTWSLTKVKSFRSSALLSSMVWIFSIMLSVPEVVFSELMVEHGRQVCIHNYGNQATAWRIILRFQLNCIGFLLPLLVMVFFYSCITHALLQSRSLGKQKTLMLVITLVVVFFILWCPYNVVLFLHSLQDLHVFLDCELSKHLDYAMQVTESLAFIHCCLNPILYAFVNKRFRLHLLKVWKRVCRRREAATFNFTETSQHVTSDTHTEMMSF